jgi:small neutral amino acid transporter SnatA (MarC family)
VNLGLAVLATVVALDLPQRSALLREWPTRVVALAAGLTSVAVLSAATLATPMLDALDVSAPTMQIGAAMVLVLWSAWMLFAWDVRPAATTAPGVARDRDALVPGTFPIVFTPVVGVLALAIVARRGVAAAAVPAVAALAVLVAVRAALGRRSLRRLAAVAGIVVGVALMADGVLDV